VKSFVFRPRFDVCWRLLQAHDGTDGSVRQRCWATVHISIKTAPPAFSFVFVLSSLFLKTNLLEWKERGICQYCCGCSNNRRQQPMLGQIY
jgi:hypothetical protein